MNKPLFCLQFFVVNTFVNELFRFTAIVQDYLSNLCNPIYSNNSCLWLVTENEWKSE